MKALWYSFRYCRVPENMENMDRLTKIVAASRLCVIPMTIYSVTIGALIAWIIAGKFNFILYLAILLGFTASHLLDNLVNDYYDYERGIDDPGYFRALYGPHPFIDSIISKSELNLVIGLIGLYDALLTVYLSTTVSPWIAILAVIGAFIILGYAGIGFDAKRSGLGEVLVAVVWGPVMIGGTIIAMMGSHPLYLLLIYLPYSLAVSLVLIGKHMDKHPHDLEKKVRTLPVRLGLANARKLAVTLAVILPITGFIAVYYYYPLPYAGIILLTLAISISANNILLKPKPSNPPEKWEVWPLWYVAAGYAVMDSLGRTTITALLAIGLYYSSHQAIALALTVIDAAWEIITSSSIYKIFH